MSRIVGLNDLKKKDDEEKDPRQEQLFAGGLDQRGYVPFFAYDISNFSHISYILVIFHTVNPTEEDLESMY